MLHRLHRFIYRVAHKGENVLHVCYLFGVSVGGGYKYAAMGMLICICLVAVLKNTVEE